MAMAKPPLEKPIKIAGMEAIIGPKRGMISKIAAKAAKSRALGMPIIKRPR